MADVKWTKEQQDAIFDKGNNILVAAAAGSGKTAVLVERIINKVINENVDIDKILVVTFTNAAASEMRERILEAIYKKIEEFPDNRNLQRQIILINKASICTIDAFCLDIIRNNFFEIDASANFRVADGTEIELLKQEVIDDIFEEKYLNNDKMFLKLIDTYTTYRDDEPLKQLILKIYKYIQSSPFPEDWLHENVEKFNLKDKLDLDFGQTVWGKIILGSMKENIESYIVTLKKIAKDLAKYDEMEKYSLCINQDIINMDYILQHFDTWDSAYESVNATVLAKKDNKWPSDRKITLEIKDIAKTQRDMVWKNFESQILNILIYNSYEANSDISKMYEIFYGLESLILEFSNAFAKIKKEKNVVDFGDIEHFALKILVKNEDGKIIVSDVAKKYQEQFQEIAIDEYQDSNMVQELILTSVSKGNNIFMVGDVKQSIYKFRQACPELFLEKYEKYKLKDSGSLSDGQKIQLFKNFRSRANILDVTNIIFEDIMSAKLGDITYNKTEFLNLGADYKAPENPEITNIAGKTELKIIDLKEPEINVFKGDENSEEEQDNNEERIENVVLEARFVANEIKKFIDSEYFVFDKHSKDYRPVTYKDIVVLLRATSVAAPIYENEIAKLNMPVFSDVSSEYLESMEIKTIMSLLKVIDNPMQDIPLVTVLRSSIAGFTDNELVEIRMQNKNQAFYNSLKQYKGNEKLEHKISRFLKEIKRWQAQEKYMALDELIWQIYLDTGFYNYVTLMQNGALRQANLKMLFERAKQYESASFKGLFNFISFIDKLHTKNGDLSSAKLIGESENVIRIMSIHKSKGLEFPVVYLCGTGKQFNFMDLNDSILMHQKIGFGPKFIDTDRKIEYSTLAKEAIKIRAKIESMSEEMRVLYVALTRAKEKLIITGVSKDASKALNDKMNLLDIYDGSTGSKKISEAILKKYKTYLDWIELVYLNNGKMIKDYIDMDIYNKQDLLKQFEKQKADEKTRDIVAELNSMAKDVSDDDIKELKDKLSWMYGYMDSVTIPTKTSVTKIKELAMEDKIVSMEEMGLFGDEIGNKSADINVVVANEYKKIDNKQDSEGVLYDKGVGGENENSQIEAINKEFDNEVVNKEYKTELARPKFLNSEIKLTSAQKGTLMHLCFQRLDHTRAYTKQDLIDFVENMVQREIITRLEADSINIYKLMQYTNSDLWKALKNAKKVYKEQPFYISLKSNEVFKSKADDTVLVQGIIDLYYINQDGEIVLVDYKTDWLNEGEEQKLIDKYSKQLEIYKGALEKALKKNVSQTYIYSVCLNKMIKLDL